LADLVAAYVGVSLRLLSRLGLALLGRGVALQQFTYAFLNFCLFCDEGGVDGSETHEFTKLIIEAWSIIRNIG
jgi:hypothetical protein